MSLLCTEPVDSGVLLARMNRPEVRNALSLPLIAELQAALGRAEAEGLRAVVLSGAGKAFSAGAISPSCPGMPRTAALTMPWPG